MRVDTIANEAFIGTDSATMVSVVVETSSKDSTNGASLAGELPTQIREALEKASKQPMHWTWEYLHRTARKKVRYTKLLGTGSSTLLLLKRISRHTCIARR